LGKKNEILLAITAGDDATLLPEKTIELDKSGLIFKKAWFSKRIVINEYKIVPIRHF
jgi:hypothetical protein